MRDLEMDFEIAGGSVRGKNHELANKNNQDAYCWATPSDGFTVAVVCDGCSAGKHSEVGAKIGSNIVRNEITKRISHDWNETKSIKHLTENIVSQLHFVSAAMSSSPFEILGDYFLFTIIVAIIGPDKTYILTFGDGCYALNGEFRSIDYDNRPPYISYILMGAQKDDYEFKVRETIDTKDLKSLVIASDGFIDLVLAEEKNIPGKKKEVGHFSQFWEDDHYFKNSFNITRKLALINKSATKIDYDERQMNKEKGLLGDDTTFIVVRR